MIASLVAFQVSKISLTTDFYFKSKFIEGSHDSKNNMLFNFWTLFFKMYIFGFVIFFFAKSLSNQLSFLVVVRVYKVHIFGEAFFLTIRMLMVTKLFRVVTYRGSPPAEDVWTPSQAKCWLSARGFKHDPLIKVTWPFEKSVYLLSYGLQTKHLAGCIAILKPKS